MARKRRRKLGRLQARGTGREAGLARVPGGRLGQRAALGLLAAYLSVSIGPLAWAAEQTQTLSIAIGTDDGHEKADTTVALDPQFLTLGSNRKVALRFTGVPIAPGSKIVSAKIRLHVLSDGSRNVVFRYQGEASDNSPALAATANNFSNRPLTAASVTETPPAWPNGAYAETTDVSPILQEIVDRPGWASGNAATIFILDGGTSNNRTVASRDNTGNLPPQLVVTWDPTPPPPPPPKTITVTGPNGGEIWPLGSTQAVTWNSTGNIQNVKIELSQNSGTTWETLAASEPNDGVFAWLAWGSDTTAGMVRISDASDAGIADASDAVFALAPQTTPTSQLYTIAAGNDDGHERNDGSVVLDIQMVVLGVNRKGGFRFTGLQIPPGAAIVSAKLKVYATADVNRSVNFAYRAEAADSSAPFTTAANNFSSRPLTTAVVYGIPPSWVLNAYNETTDLAPLFQEVVNRPGWSIGNALSLFVLNNGGANNRTVASKDNTGNFPPQISISWTTGTPPSQPRTISIVSPASGDTWEVGLKKEIRWSTTGSISQVMIELSRDNGTTWEVLSAAEPNDGLFTWPAVTGPSTTLAVVRVSDTTAPSTFGTSPTSSPFVIVDNPESITVTTPNGGETWPATTAQMIKWTWTGGIQSVKVEVSRDGGTTWELLTQNATNDGDSNWTVTGPETTNALIRVSAMDGSASDVSDAPFAIGAAPPQPPPIPKTLFVSYPNGGEVWLVGNQVNIHWATTGDIPQVTIQVSRDAGTSWETISSGAPNDGSFTWGNITGPDTLTGLIKISASNDPQVFDSSDALFSLSSKIQGLRLHLAGIDLNDDKELILSQGGSTTGRVQIIGSAFLSTGVTVSAQDDTTAFKGGNLKLTADLSSTNFDTATSALVVIEDPQALGFSLPFRVFANPKSEGFARLVATHATRSHERLTFVTSETKTLSPSASLIGRTTRHTITIRGEGTFTGGAASDGFVKVSPPDGVTVKLFSISLDRKQMVVDITVAAGTPPGRRTISVEIRRRFDKQDDHLGGTQVKGQQSLGDLTLDLLEFVNNAGITIQDVRIFNPDPFVTITSPSDGALAPSSQTVNGTTIFTISIEGVVEDQIAPIRSVRVGDQLAALEHSNPTAANGPFRTTFKSLVTIAEITETPAPTVAELGELNEMGVESFPGATKVLFFDHFEVVAMNQLGNTGRDVLHLDLSLIGDTLDARARNGISVPGTLLDSSPFEFRARATGLPGPSANATLFVSPTGTKRITLLGTPGGTLESEPLLVIPPSSAGFMHTPRGKQVRGGLADRVFVEVDGFESLGVLGEGLVIGELLCAVDGLPVSVITPADAEEVNAEVVSKRIFPFVARRNAVSILEVPLVSLDATVTQEIVGHPGAGNEVAPSKRTLTLHRRSDIQGAHDFNLYSTGPPGFALTPVVATMESFKSGKGDFSSPQLEQLVAGNGYLKLGEDADTPPVQGATVFLTFDDGIILGTEDVLDTLEGFDPKLPATLFLTTGNDLSKTRDARITGLIARQRAGVTAKRYSLGNHSEAHGSGFTKGSVIGAPKSLSYPRWYAGRSADSDVADDAAGLARVFSDFELSNGKLKEAYGDSFDNSFGRLPGTNAFTEGFKDKECPVGPGGAICRIVKKLDADKGMRIFGWDNEYWGQPTRSYQPTDHRTPAGREKLLGEVDRSIQKKGRSILLFHDLHLRLRKKPEDPNEPQALPALSEMMKALRGREITQGDGTKTKVVFEILLKTTILPVTTR